MKKIGIGLLWLLFCHPAEAMVSKQDVDICIYGGTSAGVIAAYTAAKAGKSVLLIEPGTRLGGMSSGGLGYTDIGNKYVVKGLALDFYRKIGQHYGKFEQWVFEPKVALQLFQEYIKQSGVQVLYGHHVVQATKTGTAIRNIALVSTAITPDTLTVGAKVFMDCTYEGDLLAKAGVSYVVGREDNQMYQETLNGVQLMDGHQFPDGIDPYRIPGDTTSGLLWGISKETLKPNGTGDRKVQAYNYRITLTNVPENRIPITKPDHYDTTHYALLKRWKAKYPWKSIQDVFIWSAMPNGKTDINNRNGFSTDMIGWSWAYPEADYQKRAQLIKAHEDYTKGLLYFVGHDPSVPENIREEMLQWGYPKDEYEDNQHWTPQLYIREARRMVGELVMTQHHCQGQEVVKDDIGYAAYTMDSHNCDRLVVNGMVKNEGNVEVGGFPPFPIAYRAIIPKREEVSNLLVPVCLSASHIAYGSIRMEPVFMVLGQSAAFAACLAIDHGQAIQDVDIEAVKKRWKENPKGDGRKPDIWVDTQAAKVTGRWQEAHQGGYGPVYLTAAPGPESAHVRFSPGRLSGTYQLYTYVPKTKEGSSQAQYRVFDGQALTAKMLNLADVEVLGQTSGEWIALGTYHFSNTQENYVDISTEGADGLITANAILYVPKE